MIRQLEGSGVSQRRKLVSEVSCACPALHEFSAWLLTPWCPRFLESVCSQVAKEFPCASHLDFPGLRMHKLVLLEKETALEGKALNAAVGIAGPSINNLQTRLKPVSPLKAAVVSA